MTNINWVQRTTQISIILIGLVFAFSCSKRKLVYYSPNMEQPKPINQGTITTHPQITIKGGTSLAIKDHNNLPLASSAFTSERKELNQVASKIGKTKEVGQTKKLVIKEKPKLDKGGKNRFLLMYIGLGIIALAGILMLILLNIPSLKGDIGCLFFLILLLLGGSGFVTSLVGLITGLLDS